MSRDRSLLRQAPSRPLRRPLLATAVLAAVVATTVPAALTSASAEEGDTSATSSAGFCPPKLARQLNSAADRFAVGCDVAGDSATADAEIPSGEMDMSENMELIANVPKQGAFTAETSYNSDMAFQGKYAYAGNYDGFTVYDISTPSDPTQVAQVACAGSQNDISVLGDLLVLSVDSSRNDNSCTSVSQSASVQTSWEGIRVFDISNPAEPEYVAAVETDCGSHTHTLAPSDNGKQVYVYVSSYSPNDSFPDCRKPHDQISVVKIHRAYPEGAQVISEPKVFPEGGNPTGNYSATTAGCHDITAYPSKDIAAGACMGDGVLMDISDRANPVVTEVVRDRENFAFWHSATFNNAGTKVVFTDELGGGGAATCNPEVGPTKGADAVYQISKRGQLKFRSYYKIPRTNSDTENCVAHNGSLIPVKGRDVMVQAWYQGGISVWDFTDATRPQEIGWFDRGPISDERLVLGGSWSAYWYRGHIYSNDIQQGLDVLKITDDRLTPLARQPRGAFNAQAQPSFNG